VDLPWEKNQSSAHRNIQGIPRPSGGMGRSQEMDGLEWKNPQQKIDDLGVRLQETT
jgi:hypothetical protein